MPRYTAECRVGEELLKKEREKLFEYNCHVLTIADINECIQEPCGDQDQARCSNSIGSYICFCDIIGYGWNGTACEGTAQSMLRQTHIIISTLVCRC